MTLYGDPNPESLRWPLRQRSSRIERRWKAEAIRHLGVWPERGAVGDAAWRDSSGQLVTSDLEIPLETFHSTARQLLSECGQLIRRLVAGLSMPDWPEGARRAISISIGPIVGITATGVHPARVG